MHLKINPQTKILSLITVVIIVFSPFMAQAATTQTQTSTNSTSSTVQLTTTSEYTNYVHNFVSSCGNCTYLEKPMFPVQIQSSQIPIGQNWILICPLQAGHNYHVYFYGAYINVTSQAKTDYDVYIYDPKGNLESTHTQSAGLPEHLGTTVKDALFTPSQSGNYTFVINNNPVDSKGAEEATFMIIENLQCDQWYTSQVEGTNGGNAAFNTNWAYEFETNASHVQLYVNVPGTLDMYEARLYLMNNAQSPTLDGYPLAWEPGLYGNLTGSVGGYNFEPNGYRGVAYASCEHMGQSMTLNYTSTNAVRNLYQLVLIGEVGSGTIQLMLKDNFTQVSLTPSPVRIFPETPTTLNFISDGPSMQTAQLSYTTDNWTKTISVNMKISNQTCSAPIPPETPGTFVQYKVNATDILANNLFASGNFTMENASLIPLTVPAKVFPGIPTDLTFASNGTKLETAQLSYTLGNWTKATSMNMNVSNETCSATIPGQATGALVQYRINATDVSKNGLSTSGNFTVKEPLTLNITATKNKIAFGQNITISGFLSPNYQAFAAISNSNNTANSKNSNATSNAQNPSATTINNGSTVIPNYKYYNNSIGEVEFCNVNSNQTAECVVSGNGTFVATFRPDASGVWAVMAMCPESQTSYSCYSQQITIKVTPTPIYVKYSIFIVAGLIAAMAAGGAVYFLKFRAKW